MSKKKKMLLITGCVLLGLMLLGIGAIFGINAYVKGAADGRILTSQEAAMLEDVDCILVLGCGVKDDGQPSDMLHDRLQRSMELYHLGAAPKLLMTGDHGRTGYDEVNTMKAFAMDAGAASEDVFMDHAGFSTYESIYRAKAVFKARKIIIVSQEYHLYRAIYIAQSLGMEAYGVHSDYRNYAGQAGFDAREVLARIKDVATCIVKPAPTYLGDAIPISGNGNLTNDENSDSIY